MEHQTSRGVTAVRAGGLGCSRQRVRLSVIIGARNSAVRTRGTVAILIAEHIKVTGLKNRTCCKKLNDDPKGHYDIRTSCSEGEGSSGGASTVDWRIHERRGDAHPVAASGQRDAHVPGKRTRVGDIGGQGGIDAGLAALMQGNVHEGR